LGIPEKEKKQQLRTGYPMACWKIKLVFFNDFPRRKKTAGNPKFKKIIIQLKDGYIMLHLIHLNFPQFHVQNRGGACHPCHPLPSLAICHAAVDADGLVGNHQHVGGASQGQCEGSLRQSGTLQPAANAVLGVGQQAQVPEMAAPDPSDWRSDLETRGFCSNMR
jgi:hypothetical protein